MASTPDGSKNPAFALPQYTAMPFFNYSNIGDQVKDIQDFYSKGAGAFNQAPGGFGFSRYSMGWGGAPGGGGGLPPIGLPPPPGSPTGTGIGIGFRAPPAGSPPVTGPGSSPGAGQAPPRGGPPGTIPRVPGSPGGERTLPPWMLPGGGSVGGGTSAPPPPTSGGGGSPISTRIPDPKTGSSVGLMPGYNGGTAQPTGPGGIPDFSGVLGPTAGSPGYDVSSMKGTQTQTPSGVYDLGYLMQNMTPEWLSAHGMGAPTPQSTGGTPMTGNPSSWVPLSQLVQQNGGKQLTQAQFDAAIAQYGGIQTMA